MSNVLLPLFIERMYKIYREFDSHVSFENFKYKMGQEGA